MSGRVLVIGDIHGNLLAFNQCIMRCEFSNEDDTLIQLGDVSDRYPDTALVVERLLSIKNLIAIRGNHDEWTNKWISYGTIDPVWINNGGQETIDSYMRMNNKIQISEHIKFFTDRQVNYYVDESNRIFVHGGFTNPNGPSYDLIKNHCLWDRSLWTDALIGLKLNRKPYLLSKFFEIFIGHTPTLTWSKEEPMNAFNVWNIDTGAGMKGRLTIMDVNTKQYWQSDYAHQLYKTGNA